MTASFISEPKISAGDAAARTVRDFTRRNLSQLVLSPTVASTLLVVYGFILWTLYISFSKSRMTPDYSFAGFEEYVRLWSSPRWYTAVGNMLVFTSLYVVICIAVGLLLAILLDQHIRIEGALRTIYLYPMAISFIVAGTAWKWILNPGIGIQKFMRDLGWSNFTFDWITDRNMAIYTLVIAAVWQASGFVMALFLAGLRGVDQEIVKAAHLDGAGAPRIYWSIIIPSLKPVFMSAIVILIHLSVKSFDLVVAMTAGGPGTASDLPATFMFSMIFQKNQLGTGAASAMMMLCVIVAVIVPYLYSELGGGKDG
ncbi:carbohydrate ABC transporter permease [Rhizobium sp. CF142]|uniref:carbohydrate ABC transporter permease n=1 Tax=Rhizobium sp. CF142 TaxID=1144314 RepID=UPI00026EF4E1|nr:sugar ABC transporter permease [Rhizobium sp. CF142]EJJ27087.1 permease component of ABC-type sugar transporter [Rhizobium sp. CF142]